MDIRSGIDVYEDDGCCSGVEVGIRILGLAELTLAEQMPSGIITRPMNDWAAKNFGVLGGGSPSEYTFAD